MRRLCWQARLAAEMAAGTAALWLLPPAVMFLIGRAAAQALAHEVKRALFVEVP